MGWCSLNAFTRLFQKGKTPQSQAIPGSKQVANSAGGFSFAVDEWTRLDRFLILGTDSGSYYATERALTLDNAEVVARCLDLDPKRVVAQVVAISDAGRAPKNAPAIFALAVAAGTGYVREIAEADALRKVCRTPTDLFAFAATLQSLRGWGSGLRRLVARLVRRAERGAARLPRDQVRPARRLDPPRPPPPRPPPGPFARPPGGLPLGRGREQGLDRPDGPSQGSTRRQRHRNRHA